MTKILPLFLLILNTYAKVDFPISYNESREYFRKEIGLNGGTLSTYKVGSLVDNDLTLDAGYFPAKKTTKNLIILSSGIHGPEAFLGSYAQRIFLKHFVKSVDFNKTGVLLIHSINPYGFKYGRRVSEENIDLNRNMSIDGRLFSNKNAEHNKMLNILSPKEMVEDRSMFGVVWGVLKKLASGTPMKVIRSGVTSGQYEHKKSLYFGGSHFSENRNILLKIFKKRINAYKNILSLDFHTGLGKEGVLHLISGSEKYLSKKSISLQKKIFTNSKSNMYELTTSDTPGFYSTSGDLNDFIAEIAGKEKEVVAMTAEFGTMGLGLWQQLKTINYMIKENQGYHWGYSSKDLEKNVKSDFKNVFYPKRDSWKNEVKRRILYLYNKPMKVFNKL